MQNIGTYDILIIGAGPAGSSAALSAARGGSKVLLVENKEVVGVPVRCAEYIPKVLLGELPFKDRSFVCQPVKGILTILPDGKSRWTKAPGLMIHRHRLDQLLLDAALNAGAEILTGTKAIAIEEHHVIVKNRDNSLKKVSAKIIVGADGPHSVVRGWMELPRLSLVPALQVKIVLSRSMEHAEVYFHREIYGGYGWVFPKGEVANVGVAVMPGTRWSGPLKRVLHWFLKELEGERKIKGKPISLTGGWIPVQPVSESVKGRFVLVGDAAGHAHPITGAGISPAIVYGKLAGKWASRAVECNDTGLLLEYHEAWNEEYGETLVRACARRETLEKNWHMLLQILPKCWPLFPEYHMHRGGF